MSSRPPPPPPRDPPDQGDGAALAIATKRTPGKRRLLPRSTALRLALGYAALFILSSAVLVGWLWWRTAAALDHEVDAVILADAQAIGDRLHDFGLPGAVETVRQRVAARADDQAIYLLADPTLAPVAGNLAGWPLRIGAGRGWYRIPLARDGRLHATRILAVGLPGGFRLLVGRDVQDRAAIRAVILGALGWSALVALVLALAGGVLARRAVLGRLDDINRTASAIVRGDLSRRLPSRQTDDEFDQLAQTINGMLQQIEILVDGVRNASNVVAHDLRTPLAELRGRLEDLARGLPPDQPAGRGVQAAVEDLDRLIGVFNALLRLAEIDSGARIAGFRAVDVTAVLTEVVELYGPVAEDKGLALTVDPLGEQETTVTGDPFLLAQAIGNLIDNAVKYTPAPGAVRVRMDHDPDGALRVAVIDTGPGIPEAERCQVTQRFYRGDSARGMAGVGLGLSLVAAVARLHGGHLDLEDAAPPARGLAATLVLRG